MSDIKVGDKGAFRPWGSLELPVRVTVGTCQDTGFLGIKLDSTGCYVHFSNTTGQVEGERCEPTATGEERVMFNGNNIMLSRSGSIESGPIGVFEFFLL